jgi:CDGSH-type Zn-finger protein
MGNEAVRGALAVIHFDSKRCVKTAFCRCGHSHTRPFCDGTHTMVGFTAPA